MLKRKKVHLLLTIICLIEVVLLSVASVSPSWHNRLFHGSTTEVCAHSREIVQTDAAGCWEGHEGAGRERNEKPVDTEDERNCPVAHFSGGLVIWDEPIVAERHQELCEWNLVEQGDRIYLERVWRVEQARAPPIIES